MHKLLLLTICSFLNFYSYGQKEANIWLYNGHSLNFNVKPVEQDTNSAITYGAGSSDICDTAGNVLFYTDGETVYTKNHTVMPGGTGLAGNAHAAQSAMIIKHYKDASKYYVFTNDYYASKSVSKGLNYSVVDMSLNGGLGAVTSKNNLLYQNTSEKITATYHGNCGDVWVIVKDNDSNKYCSYILTAGGVSSTPIISYGTKVPQRMPTVAGTMKMNPDGSKIIVANDSLFFLDFDNATGKVSNQQNLTPYSSIGGVNYYYTVFSTAFSSTGKYLYFTNRYGAIERIDISLPTPAMINASREGIFVPPPPQYNIPIELAADGNIYLRYGDNDVLVRIESSNKPIDKQNYYSGAHINNLSGYIHASTMQHGFPTIFSGYVYKPEITLPVTNVFCKKDTIDFELFVPSCSDSVRWDFDDPGSGTFNTSNDYKTKHVYSASGNYVVKVHCWLHGFVETRYDTITIFPDPVINLGNDTSICRGQNIIYNLSNTLYDSAVWVDNIPTYNYTIDSQGQYNVVVYKHGCRDRDRINVTVQEPFKLMLGKDTVICKGEGVLLDATIPNGVEYKWSDIGNGPSQRQIIAQDTYSVKVYDGVCYSLDTIFIGIYNYQLFTLGKDTSLCLGTNIKLNAKVDGGSYLWNDGSVSADRLINTSGNYRVTVTDSVCITTDSIKVDFTTPPKLNLGNDTTLCKDDKLLLQAQPGFKKYMWSNGDTTSFMEVYSKGEYKVVGSFLNCLSLDSITIDYYPPLPELNLIPDTIVCKNSVVMLDAHYYGYYELIWQDGTKGSKISVTGPGIYKVHTQNHVCGFVSDSVYIEYLEEDCRLFVPSAFTPNRDGLNDSFFPIGYGVEVERMQIFNRWGELLFDNNQPWDGTYKGVTVPNGTYLYIIIYKEQNGGRKYTKGTVQVLR